MPIHVPTQSFIDGSMQLYRLYDLRFLNKSSPHDLNKNTRIYFGLEYAVAWSARTMLGPPPAELQPCLIPPQQLQLGHGGGLTPPLAVAMLAVRQGGYGAMCGRSC